MGSSIPTRSRDVSSESDIVSECYPVTGEPDKREVGGSTSPGPTGETYPRSALRRCGDFICDMPSVCPFLVPVCIQRQSDEQFVGLTSAGKSAALANPT